VPAPTQWYDIEFTGDARGSEADLEEELIARMHEAVRSRMVADVPLGAFLSGGVDSSAVVAMMSDISQEPVQTCSIGFDETSYDETRYADLVADRFGTDHRRRTVASDDFTLVDRLVRSFDEPFADPSALPTYRVCELAREKVKVSLSGDGGDEAFAGYRRYHLFNGEEKVRSLLPATVRRPLFGTLNRLYPRLDWAPRPMRLKQSFEKLARPKGCTGPVLTSALLRGQIYSAKMKSELQGHYGEERYIRTLETAPAEGAVARAQYADFKIYLPGDILTKLDRTSMSVSLEAREPLLDHRLIEFAARLPTSLQLKGGTGKWLMKRSLRRYLPDEILYRKKMGFSTPVSPWFRGPLADEGRAVARGSALLETGWFDATQLEAKVSDHISGRADHGYLLWQLMILDKSLTNLFGLGNTKSAKPLPIGAAI
jgi:asparagine synthase (glutamine-hydrolysing)